MDNNSLAMPQAARAVVPDGIEPLRVSPVPASIPIAEWRNTKAQRDALRQMFDGRCAYCGGELGKMHVDHVEPCIRVTRDPMGRALPASECFMVKPERNTVANMMPACAPCNLHKGGYSLEGWRDIIQRSAAICRRDTSTFKVGERFGVIAVHEQPVKFFFEKCRICEGGVLYPQYGVAPHDCYWRKGPEFVIGQSTLKPITAQDCFIPDLEDGEGWTTFAYPNACGVYYCPGCQRDQYQLAWARLIAKFGPEPAQAIETRSVMTEGHGPKETAPRR